MRIESGTSIVVVVNRQWANLSGVRPLIRPDRPHDEIGGSDASHVILARVKDAHDPHGIWLDNSGQHQAAPDIPLRVVFVPWPQIIAMAIFEKDSPSLWQDNKSIGFDVSDFS